MLQYFKRRTSMFVASILFFYLGCYVTLIFVKVDCVSPNSDVFKLYNEHNSVEYAILILTSPVNEVKRDAIRDTWLNLVSNLLIENGEKKIKWNHTTSKNYKLRSFTQVYFAVGTCGLSSEKLKELKAEQRRTKDLLLLDNIEDSYKNLAFKVKHSLKWLSENLNKLKYVIKCDDDSFVRIDLIIMNLETYAPNMNAPRLTKYISNKGQTTSYNGLYWGYFDGRAKVYFNGKWEERDWFLCDNYLPYALGGGYVISRSVVDYIAHNAEILRMPRVITDGDIEEILLESIPSDNESLCSLDSDNELDHEQPPPLVLGDLPPRTRPDPDEDYNSEDDRPLSTYASDNMPSTSNIFTTYPIVPEPK